MREGTAVAADVDGAQRGAADYEHHPLRRIKQMAGALLMEVFDRMCSTPSIPPERLLKASLLKAL